MHLPFMTEVIWIGEINNRSKPSPGFTTLVYYMERAAGPTFVYNHNQYIDMYVTTYLCINESHICNSLSVCDQGLTRKSRMRRKRRKRRRRRSQSQRRATVSGRVLLWRWGRSHPPGSWRRLRAGSRLSSGTWLSLRLMRPQRPRASPGTRLCPSPSPWDFRRERPPGPAWVRRRTRHATLTCRTPRIPQLSGGRPAPRASWPASVGGEEGACRRARGRGLNKSPTLFTWDTAPSLPVLSLSIKRKKRGSKCLSVSVLPEEPLL